MPGAIVQSAEIRSTSSVASIELAFDSNVTVDRILLASTTVFPSSSSNADGMTDSQSNDYTRDAAHVNFTGVEFHSAKAGSSSANTVTYTPSANAFLSLVVMELSGMVTTSWFDTSVDAHGTSNTPDAGTLTTGAQSGLAFWQVCHVAGGNPSIDPPSGWTEVEEEENTSFNPYHVASRLTDPSTGYGTQGTLGASPNWDVVAANYKAAADENVGTLGYLTPNKLRPAIFAPGIPR